MLQLRYTNAGPLISVRGIEGFYAGHVRTSFGSSSRSGPGASRDHVNKLRPLMLSMNAWLSCCLNCPSAISLLSAIPQMLHEEVLHNSSHF